MIWSPSQRFTAELFMKLKEGRHQPDPKAAAQINAADDDEAEGGSGTADQSSRRAPQVNSAAMDVLRKLPGVTQKNIFALARRAGSLAGILEIPEDELAGIVGRLGAQQLLAFLHKEASTTFVGGAAQAEAADSPEVVAGGG
eukprot:gnl/TRDRNA2_/TRDRNA2_164189_c1_seq1.p1 gnl/TRDRNA2_/TRDRNA2_164189_c1~~gnl/TRDRNA2_/TRDRNA2_164189_c1_seq1.p1  ORF type:complete len:142 (+),score=45.25 gnl/TRDRNA2_/TRDRNA2_164189_c1_seq1:89-514(+)